MFYLTGISISLFLCLLLLGKRKKTQADKILTVWLFVLCLHLFLYYCSFSPIIHGYPFLFGLHFPMPLLHGPFLYLYAGALTNNLTTNKKKLYLLHFVPILICYISFFKFYALPFDQKIDIVRRGGDGYQPVYSISIVSSIISGIVYVIITSILLHRHRRRILNQFSYTEKITLRWLQYLTYGIGVIWIFIIFSHDETIFGIAVFFILFVGYFGIKQVGIFTQNSVLADRYLVGPSAHSDNNKTEIKKHEREAENDYYHKQIAEQQDTAFDKDVGIITETSDDLNTNKKYSKSGLTNESANRLHMKLVGVMNAEKLFKEPDLTLAQLANRLHTNPNYLSQVINEKENKNFYDYINTLRAREFISIVANAGNQKYTLLGLAYDCGFNSKSSFNRNFKKITGQTPTEFLNTNSITGVS